ncbi:hypothetical protein [Acetomicrobium sp.]|uniref:hypothetical protein n=1 Tax=Acetomicrobium sp. TaxID=1872099 RepID=UPI002FCC13F2
MQFYSSEDVDRWADVNCLEKLRKIFVDELTAEGIANSSEMLNQLKLIMEEGINKEK